MAVLVSRDLGVVSFGTRRTVSVVDRTTTCTATARWWKPVTLFDHEGRCTYTLGLLVHPALEDATFHQAPYMTRAPANPFRCRRAAAHFDRHMVLHPKCTMDVIQVHGSRLRDKRPWTSAAIRCAASCTPAVRPVKRGSHRPRCTSGPGPRPGDTSKRRGWRQPEALLAASSVARAEIGALAGRGRRRCFLRAVAEERGTHRWQRPRRGRARWRKSARDRVQHLQAGAGHELLRQATSRCRQAVDDVSFKSARRRSAWWANRAAKPP